jgi:hypothetical protein
MYIYSKCAELVKPKPTAARLSSVSLADFFARKDLADFLLEALLDFLAVGSSFYRINKLSKYPSLLYGTLSQSLCVSKHAKTVF